MRLSEGETLPDMTRNCGVVGVGVGEGRGGEVDCVWPSSSGVKRNIKLLLVGCRTSQHIFLGVFPTLLSEQDEDVWLSTGRSRLERSERRPLGSLSSSSSNGKYKHPRRRNVAT